MRYFANRHEKETLPPTQQFGVLTRTNGPTGSGFSFERHAARLMRDSVLPPCLPPPSSCGTDSWGHRLRTGGVLGETPPSTSWDDPVIRLGVSGMRDAAEEGGDDSSSSSSSSTPRLCPSCLLRRLRPRPVGAARPPSSRRTAGRRWGGGPVF